MELSEGVEGILFDDVRDMGSDSMSYRMFRTVEWTNVNTIKKFPSPM